MVRSLHCLFQLVTVLLHGGQLLISEFHHFHEALDCFAGFDELRLVFGHKERTLDARHPIETSGLVWITTESVIAQDRVDFHIVIGIGFCIDQCLDQPTVAFRFGVGSSQLCGIDPRIVLGRSRIFVSEPLHQLPDREALRGILK